MQYIKCSNKQSQLKITIFANFLVISHALHHKGHKISLQDRLGHWQVQHTTDGFLELLVVKVVCPEVQASLPQLVSCDQDVLNQAIKFS